MGFNRVFLFILVAVAIAGLLRFGGRPYPVRVPIESSSVFAVDSPDLSDRWVVSADRAKRLIEDGATLLDARPSKLSMPDRLGGAIAVRWQDFSQPNNPNRGKLIEDDRVLTEKLQAIGIFNDRPVVAIGDPVRGWGEEGRIVWMLRSLGHRQAVFVDGGGLALAQVDLSPIESPTPLGDFTIEHRGMWSIDRDALHQGLERDNWVVIDTREPREYAGETPYGETRGGHIPGAVHLYYKTLLTDEGKLLDRPSVRSLLLEKGITREDRAIAYCTGGVRSAWLTAVLADLGFEVKNYPGSMWEWSADRKLPIQL
ncbi:sulfurtransferase [Oscillatoriales cyanobacterium LEGE 11467]|uniref:thiosulfate sulfurtransferase n=1 Tax=Zarconia navalis LEGE 11467 TaxID=1828826 RepID=A0A928VXL0_9CYAN|nr:rhodanese-like domain-containing protein [Zarconia navalis]MBE9040003.1 sulfurtransferase [Zarconia navalis LEGE 11467]